MHGEIQVSPQSSPWLYGLPLDQGAIRGGIGGQPTANELLTWQADPTRKARENLEMCGVPSFVVFLISPRLPVIRRNS